MKVSSSSACLISFFTPTGLMLLSLLYLICISLLLSVSSIALRIEPVVTSPYRIHLPSKFLAALPIVCINDLSDLRKPSLSASNSATSSTSSISKRSLNKFIPTKTSNSPFLKSLIISTLSTVSISECKYLTLMLCS